MVPEPVRPVTSQCAVPESRVTRSRPFRLRPIGLVNPGPAEPVQNSAGAKSSNATVACSAARSAIRPQTAASSRAGGPVSSSTGAASPSPATPNRSEPGGSPTRNASPDRVIVVDPAS